LRWREGRQLALSMAEFGPEKCECGKEGPVREVRATVR
jgi:hypothetical protein